MNRNIAASPDQSAEPRPRVRITWVIVCILIASTATMTTTGLGMDAIFGYWLVAAVMTILAQVVLIATSWMLGKDIARLASGDFAAAGAGRGVVGNLIRGGFLLGTFGLVFFICWFFSFNFYFNRMFSGGEDQLEAEQQPHEAADPILFSLRQRVDDALREDANLLLRRPEVETYLNWISKVQRAAQDSSVAKRVAVQLAADNKAKLARQQETQDTIDRLRAQLATLNQSKQQMETTRAAQQQDSQNADTAVSALRKQLDELNSGLIKAKDDAARELAQGGENRRPGPGPVWQQLNDSVLALAKKIDQIQQRQFAPLQAQQHTLHDTLAGTERQLADTNRAIAAMNQQIADAQAQLPATSIDANGAPDTFAGLRQQVTPARDNFAANPSPDTYKSLVDACVPIATLLRSVPDLAGGLQGGDCRSEPVELALRSRPRMLAVQNDFQKNCSLEAVDPRIAAITARLRQDLAVNTGVSLMERRAILGKALDETQSNIVIPCLGMAAQAGATTQDLETDLRRFVQRHTLRQDSFSQTRNAAFGLFDGTANNAARLGAWIALAQDSFILLLSILGDIFHRERVSSSAAPRRLLIAEVDWAAHPDDPPTVAAAKTILRAARDGSRGRAYLPRDFEANVPTEQHDNVARIVQQLMRSRAVRQRLRGGLVVDAAAVEAIEELVMQHDQTQTKLPEGRAGQSSGGKVATRAPAPTSHDAAMVVPDEISATSGTSESAVIVEAGAPGQPAVAALRVASGPGEPRRSQREGLWGRIQTGTANELERYVDAASPADRSAAAGPPRPAANMSPESKTFDRLRLRAAQEQRGRNGS